MVKIYTFFVRFFIYLHFISSVSSAGSGSWISCLTKCYYLSSSMVKFGNVGATCKNISAKAKPVDFGAKTNDTIAIELGSCNLNKQEYQKYWINKKFITSTECHTIEFVGKQVFENQKVDCMTSAHPICEADVSLCKNNVQHGLSSNNEWVTVEYKPPYYHTSTGKYTYCEAVKYCTDLHTKLSDIDYSKFQLMTLLATALHLNSGEELIIWIHTPGVQCPSMKPSNATAVTYFGPIVHLNGMKQVSEQHRALCDSPYIPTTTTPTTTTSTTTTPTTTTSTTTTPTTTTSTTTTPTTTTSTTTTPTTTTSTTTTPTTTTSTTTTPTTTTSTTTTPTTTTSTTTTPTTTTSTTTTPTTTTSTTTTPTTTTSTTTTPTTTTSTTTTPKTITSTTTIPTTTTSTTTTPTTTLSTTTTPTTTISMTTTPTTTTSTTTTPTTTISTTTTTAVSTTTSLTTATQKATSLTINISSSTTTLPITISKLTTTATDTSTTMQIAGVIVTNPIHSNQSGWVQIGQQEYYVNHNVLPYESAKEFCEVNLHASLLTFTNPMTYFQMLLKLSLTNGSYWIDGQVQKDELSDSGCMSYSQENLTLSTSKCMFPKYSICSRSLAMAVQQVLGDPLFITMIKEMTVEKNMTQKSIRKLICIQDNRTSAQTAGGFSVFIIGLMVALLVLSDLSNLITYVNRKQTS